ncbi:4-hydroxythreonine-4-phosphate dehydrogenase PdxA [Tuwongella immobilis]|uniref:4-hydroxythreonine-4-phosphate dehydrogenase n=1 Tax=Tuwongella immobilis TaxID=692036 RepID=A0A6C2YPS0_9BACT|nr:4-hydroxythreonine-4-phosphate dehydrogenase PdxA [Tuwongella immobilis]VIP02882.1 4-hydroxythreonine-4-phosphate dehydrogenase : 4-hydroxythreonine-4-phosphate dehydrogenase OS=Singulisphaera acidiphila (strain ATCC BAA-1392 / DSM 18658 / VKM B-2454 / MOB10) GN=pdxA PE=3 SV=1: PdxA [Tuwongella immobilis]VTS02734.1 4-hydroxythreonine-4-phosphate dehydrogenase : 4-hydroxythreonine-4-phosphate dehydrogenase OS=Singulisphaera acidiphila (strain ATCC BAA-1392 / DSM 18658 / VKM B-2454 / MOB10) GN=p
MKNYRPKLLITLGDVAGIGPEIIVNAWPELHRIAEPIVVGEPTVMLQAISACRKPLRVKLAVDALFAQSSTEQIPVIHATQQNLHDIRPGQITAAGGQAAYDFLVYAIDATLAGQADGIVTAPLHKEGLRAAGLHFPGHTEILAERTNTPAYAMVLHGDGLTVAHVTLHMALRDVFARLTPEAILEKIRLVHQLAPRLTGKPSRIAVAGLNPHAGDGGLFGDEEARIILPAVQAARSEGIDATGPVPVDTLFVRAARGEFDGVVAMYHDQGHIAMKLRSGWRNVNITAGLPIIRTSVAHGTAYDIAGQGIADASSMIAAVEVAAKLVQTHTR